MGMLRLISIFVFLIALPLSAQQTSGLFTYAVLKTSKGDIRLKLFNREAPMSVENFVGLATGKKQYRDVKTGKKIRVVAVSA